MVIAKKDINFSMSKVGDVSLSEAKA